jgi:hypothetical protein
MVTSTRMPKTDSVQQQMPPAGQHTCQRTALATATLSTRCPHTVVCCRSKQNDAGAASPRSAASTLCPATQRSFRLHRGLHGTGKVEKSARTRGGAGACVFVGLRLRRDSSTLRIGDVDRCLLDALPHIEAAVSRCQGAGPASPTLTKSARAARARALTLLPEHLD